MTEASRVVGTLIPASPSDILARLKTHRTFGNAPVEELEWLAARGELRLFHAGEVVRRKGDPISEMWVMLSGHSVFHSDRGSGRGKIFEWFGGDVAGALPYSRIVNSPGEGVTEEDSEVLVIDRSHFPEMIHAAPAVTAACVHVMVDRARHFTMEFVHDEKLVALGRLSAGLAHELNNPASAAARSARLLGGAVSEACDAAEDLGAAGLDPDRAALVRRVQKQAIGSTTGMWSALDFSDREDVIESWLETHGLATELTGALAETALTTSDLDELADALTAGQLAAAIRRIASEHATRALTTELERAASRLHELVSSVKRFTYMGRGLAAEPVDLRESIEDTVTVVAAKARARGARIETALPDALPPVLAYGGELNQVWYNLIANALDAIDDGGSVRVEACARRDMVVVTVIDDGKGIDPVVQDRIFDPFFTTKDVKQGTGLGLDIARRIVVRHNGQIEVESRPGHTAFRVLLPTATESPQAGAAKTPEPGQGAAST